MCDAACKDRDHLLSYPNLLATNVFKNGIKDFKKKILKEKETNPKLQEAILDALNSIKVNCDPVHKIYNNHEFSKGLSLGGIMHTERSAGWKNFMLGRWSPKWKEA